MATLDAIKKSMALAELGLKISRGEDISEALSGAAEFASDDEFVLDLMDNVVGILRTLAGGKLEAVLERLVPIVTALGLDGRADATAISDAMRFFDSLPATAGDLPGRIELYKKARAGEYTGEFRAIKLDVTREALSEIIAWRGIMDNADVVEEMLEYLGGLSDAEIEELGRVNVNFLRRKEG